MVVLAVAAAGTDGSAVTVTDVAAAEMQVLSVVLLTKIACVPAAIAVNVVDS
jgi:hypothetical protein